MPFPKNLEELKTAGYVFSDYGICRSCQAELEWWRTPRGKLIPMDTMERGISPAITHWSTCPDADLFRSGS